MNTGQKSKNLLEAELLISFVLRYGVLLCLFVIGVGLAIKLMLPGHGAHNVAWIHALMQGQKPIGAEPPSDVGSLWNGLLDFRGDIVIALGIMLLILLPILRVGLTTLIFLHEKDWAFFWITLTVFTVLISGIILGRAL
jgi:uncharacterized membrane protein